MKTWLFPNKVLYLVIWMVKKNCYTSCWRSSYNSFLVKKLNRKFLHIIIDYFKILTGKKVHWLNLTYSKPYMNLKKQVTYMCVYIYIANFLPSKIYDIWIHIQICFLIEVSSWWGGWCWWSLLPKLILTCYFSFLGSWDYKHLSLAQLWKFITGSHFDKPLKWKQRQVVKESHKNNPARYLLCMLKRYQPHLSDQVK